MHVKKAVVLAKRDGVKIGSYDVAMMYLQLHFHTGSKLYTLRKQYPYSHYETHPPFIGWPKIPEET